MMEPCEAFDLQYSVDLSFRGNSIQIQLVHKPLFDSQPSFQVTMTGASPEPVCISLEQFLWDHCNDRCDENMIWVLLTKFAESHRLFCEEIADGNLCCVYLEIDTVMDNELWVRTCSSHGVEENGYWSTSGVAWSEKSDSEWVASGIENPYPAPSLSGLSKEIREKINVLAKSIIADGMGCEAGIK